MHWFWRAVVAVFAGLVVAFSMLTILIPIRYYWPAVTIMHSAELMVALAVYGLLTRRYYMHRSSEGETRCRSCGYILRGISEPRCPECGERI